MEERWTKKRKQSPFCRDGTRLWIEPNYRDESVVWREIEPFIAALQFIKFERGRSAAHSIWESVTGDRYVMFLMDLGDLLRANVIKPGGWVDAVWIVTKRGRNYGIKLHSSSDDGGR